MSIFISFTEEFWQGQKEGTTMGRIEVWKTGHQWATEEIRWGTSKVAEFEEFREHWDFRDITPYHLEWLRKYVEDNYVNK